MGEIREVDAISDAIIATEREIAGEAWGLEDTDPADETGDRSLESMGDGLEGQHEADGEATGSEEQEVEDTEGEEGETEGEHAAEAAEGEEGEGEGQAATRAAAAEQPQGRVPSGMLRQANERARALEAERDELRKQLEAKGNTNPEIDALKTQIATLTQAIGQRQAPTAQVKTEPAAPAEAPDIFENPKGFVDHFQQAIRTELSGVMNVVRNNAVATSFELAHIKHGAKFDEATAAVNRLDPANQEHRSIVQSIYSSPNPGEELVKWHGRNQTFAEVGNDPAAYKERIRTETREALLKDPEFKKEMLASLRGDAQTGNNGSPRTQNRLPPSLSQRPGASTRSERIDHSALDDSEQAVADAAWR